MPERTDVDVATLLREVNAVASGNPWDKESLRDALREFVDDLADEAASFPDTLAKARWNLFAIDRDRSQDVAFVVVVVSSQRVVLLAGSGPWEAVQNFGENFLPQDAFDAVSEVSTAFRTTRTLELNRADFDEWLERR